MSDDNLLRTRVGQDSLHRPINAFGKLAPALCPSEAVPMVEAIANLWRKDKACIEPCLGPAFGLPVRNLPQVRSGLNGDLQGTRNRFSGLHGPLQIGGVEFGCRILGNQLPQALADADGLLPTKLSEGAVVPPANSPVGVVGGLGMSHDIEVFHS